MMDQSRSAKKINAGELWNKIIHNAWKSAEPGVLFWDTISREAIPIVIKRKGLRRSRPIHAAKFPSVLTTAVG